MASTHEPLQSLLFCKHREGDLCNTEVAPYDVLEVLNTNVHQSNQ